MIIDQATTLRLMAAVSLEGTLSSTTTIPATEALWSATKLAQTIAVASGKGGVGKSNVAVNVALELAELGHRVTLLDADLALANADVLLGLTPKFHLGHVLTGQRTLQEVQIEVTDGLRLIPGGSGVAELASLSLEQQARLLAELRALETDSDFMIIDTAAGIAGNVIGILKAVSEVIIVTTPDPTALVDAYATIKLMHQSATDTAIRVVVNDVVELGDADRVFKQLRTTTARFLNRDIEYLGTIPHDAELIEAVREQRPVVQYAPDTPASRALRLIARHLEISRTGRNQNRKASFWSVLSSADQ
ncbi:MAG TPA: MinD/ParA family protein [Blastocatellia bacterium]|nr:MinD/ParA family protein [Blastocatellia bacterium]